MQDLAGKVAVVTGAASGIGLAMAHRFAEAGMSVVLADIEAEPLAMAEAGLREKGAKTIALRTNVMHEHDIQQLADAAFSTFGNVHVLCNNAGVAGGSGMPAPGILNAWESPLSDWEWVFGVNFMGVLHGVRAFVPRMIANGEEGHIVNTASIAGLLTGADAYSVSKHGVVCLTEGLYKQFRTAGTKLSASVLCPGWVHTQILEGDRNRPEEFGPREDISASPPDRQRGLAIVTEMVRTGFAAEEVAGMVHDAILADQFYIIPAQDYLLAAVRLRLENILAGKNPAVGGLG
jgi:NAD(P)-dependent dehydrogenase (short-subunit alcohol dehydrogenase family)